MPWTAQSELLSNHLDSIRASQLRLDVDKEVFFRLAEMRAAVFSSVRTGQEQADIDAMRTAIRQAIDAIYIGINGAIVFDLSEVINQPDPLKVPVPLPHRETTVRGSGVPEYPAG